MSDWRIEQGDVLDVLRGMQSESVHCVVTSPPYLSLRDYGIPPREWPEVEYRPMPGLPSVTVPPMSCAFGLEPDVYSFVGHMVLIAREIYRVMRRDATFWLNFGDSYVAGPTGRQDGTVKRDRQHLKELHERLGCGGGNKYSSEAYQDSTNAMIAKGGRYRVDNMRKDIARHRRGLKPKDLMMVPERCALALQAEGFYLRSSITWCKRAPMPESVTDRPTSATEKIYLLTKAERYFYDGDAVREPQLPQSHERAQYERSTTKTNKGEPTGQDRTDGGLIYANGLNALPFALNPAGRNLWNYWLLSPEPFSLSVKSARQVRVALGDVSYGTKHIVSADCPVHGGRRSQVSTAQYGQRAAVSLNHTSHNGAGHAPEPQGDSAPTHQHAEAGSAPQNLDLQAQPCEDAATDRSNQTSRTDLAPATSPACTPSVQTADHTGGTSMLPGFSDLADHTPANNNGRGGSGDLPSVQTLSRSVGTFSLPIPPECICTFYNEITENTSHFAAFPSEIPRRAILAGTSERGVCAECGAPWRRVVERVGRVLSNGRDGVPHSPEYGTLVQSQSSGSGAGMVGDGFAKWQVETTGWQPTCKHDAPTVPALVLDPFAGSGTTLMVALRLGRRAVGIELNPEYVKLARERIIGDAPMFNTPAEELTA